MWCYSDGHWRRAVLSPMIGHLDAMTTVCSRYHLMGGTAAIGKLEILPTRYGKYDTMNTT